MDIIFLFVRITCNASKPYLRACLKPYRWWITTIKRPYHRKRTIKIRSLLSSSFQFEHPLWEGNHGILNKNRHTIMIYHKKLVVPIKGIQNLRFHDFVSIYFWGIHFVLSTVKNVIWTICWILYFLNKVYWCFFSKL